MPTVVIKLALLQEFAAHRPVGYVEDVLSRGKQPGDGTVVIPVDAYDELRAKYDPESTSGPGYELKRLLGLFGMKPVKGCQCARHARHMDKMGCDWCEQNVPTIVGWLQEEHARQKLLVPFISLAAEQLVRLAIRRARKKGIK